MDTRCANGHWITNRFTLATDPQTVDHGYVLTALMSCASNALRDDCSFCAKAYMLICDHFALDEKDRPPLRSTEDDRPANKLSRLSNMLENYFREPGGDQSDTEAQWAFVTRNGEDAKVANRA